MAENMSNKSNDSKKDAQNVDEIKSIILGAICFDWIYYSYIFNIYGSRR